MLKECWSPLQALSPPEYFPYGKASDRRDERNRYRYIGVERDRLTQLSQTGPRTYCPSTCRFLQAEPLLSEALQTSPFCYLHGRPNIGTDRSGYAASHEDGGDLGGKPSNASTTGDGVVKVFEFRSRGQSRAAKHLIVAANSYGGGHRKLRERWDAILESQYQGVHVEDQLGFHQGIGRKQIGKLFFRDAHVGMHKVEIVLELQDGIQYLNGATRDFNDTPSGRKKYQDAVYYDVNISFTGQASVDGEVVRTYVDKPENFHPSIVDGNTLVMFDAARFTEGAGEQMALDGVWTVEVALTDFDGNLLEAWEMEYSIEMVVDPENPEESYGAVVVTKAPELVQQGGGVSP